MGRDILTFRDKGTEVPSLSPDKESTGQAQNLANGLDRPGQPVTIRDGTWDGTSFDSLSCPIPQNRAEKEVLKQEILSFFLKILSAIR
jgi:hypothetical protein